MEKRLIISGSSGSGKDHLLRSFINKGLKYSPKLTTRPSRIFEKNGIDYNFIDNTSFELLISNNEMKAYQQFIIDGVIWYYGLSNVNFYSNDVFIMTPSEIANLSETDRKNSFIIYLNIERSVLEKRISNRNDNNDSVQRRLDSDKNDFLGFNNFDMEIKNPNFNSDFILNEIYTSL